MIAAIGYLQLKFCRCMHIVPLARLLYHNTIVVVCLKGTCRQVNAIVHFSIHVCHEGIVTT